MGKVLRKLQSNNGATLMLALLFFIVCAVTGSMILTSAGVSAGRLENMKRRDQNYFAVRSAIKMYEDQMLALNQMEDLYFTDTLVVEETETENGGTESSSEESYDYSVVNKKEFEGFYNVNPILQWVSNGLVSNYEEKISAGSSDKDVFYKKWFKNVSDDSTSDENFTHSETIPINEMFASYVDEETAEALKNLNVKMDVVLTPLGVLTCKIYNDVDDINNKDIYYMTLTADVEVPCQSTVDVNVSEVVDGDTTTTTTTTTYTNRYTFDFKIRDIKKG